jgi:hypothetical protein
MQTDKNKLIILTLILSISICGCRHQKVSDAEKIIREQIEQLSDGDDNLSDPNEIIYKRALDSTNVIIEKSYYRYPQDVNGVKWKDGFVHDAITAARIAEAIWHAAFGDEIYACRPYHVSHTKDSLWIVSTGSRRIDGNIEIEHSGRIRQLVFGK